MSILLHKYFNVYNFVVLLFSSSPPSSLFTAPPLLLLGFFFYLSFGFNLVFVFVFYVYFWLFTTSVFLTFLVLLLLLFWFFLFICLLPCHMAGTCFAFFCSFFFFFLHIPCIIAKSVNIEGVHEDPIESVECKSGLRHFVVSLRAYRVALLYTTTVTQGIILKRA